MANTFCVQTFQAFRLSKIPKAESQEAKATLSQQEQLNTLQVQSL